MAKEMIELVRAAEQEASAQEQRAKAAAEELVRQAQEQAKNIVDNEIARSKEAAAHMQAQAEAEIVQLIRAYEEQTNGNKRDLAEKSQSARQRAIEEMIRHIVG